MFKGPKLTFHSFESLAVSLADSSIYHKRDTSECGFMDTNCTADVCARGSLSSHHQPPSYPLPPCILSKALAKQDVNGDPMSSQRPVNLPLSVLPIKRKGIGNRLNLTIKVFILKGETLVNAMLKNIALSRIQQQFGATCVIVLVVSYVRVPPHMVCSTMQTPGSVIK